MELIRIDPKNYWKEMMKQPRIMLLAHLIEKYPEYAEMAAKAKGYKIVDNSIIEMGSSFSMERIYNAAKRVNADELILEDAYPNGPKTIQCIKNSIEWLSNNNHLGEFKLQAVCHGENLEDFKATFNYINSLLEIDVLGVPKVLCKWLPSKSRMELAHIFTNTNKEVHLLGSWFSLKEIVDIPNELWGRIRSCDTCLPSYYAINHKPILEDRNGTVDLEKEYPELNDESYNKVMAEYNYYIKEK